MSDYHNYSGEEPPSSDSKTPDDSLNPKELKKLKAESFGNLLIVDDDQVFRSGLKFFLETIGFEATVVGEAFAALQEIQQIRPSVVLLDLDLPDRNGMEIIEEILQISPLTSVIIVTGCEDLDRATEATRRGAVHYFIKPIDLEKLVETLNSLITVYNIRYEKLQTISYGRTPYKGILLTKSAERVIKLGTDNPSSTILMMGPTGCGKTLIARIIHDSIFKTEDNFIEVNCAGLAPSLLEAELFGYERGAYTGAVQSKRGLIELANNGTLFLDEICEMPLDIQAKLLTFLESRSFRRISGLEVIRSNCRIITATNKNIVEEVNAGRFRSDLYYRINVLALELPALCEEPNEILRLAEYFMLSSDIYTRKHIKGLSEEAKKILTKYSWPGNVRELKNVIERIGIYCEGETVTKESLPLEILEEFEEVSPDFKMPDSNDVKVNFPLLDLFSKDKLPTLDSLQKEYVEFVLKAVNGNKTKAAKLLGIHRSTLIRMLENK